ncbi:XdhC family protein [Ilumatobacter nonamiensis]|uniref:XdhC family protein n=1 Tax=Ilumatobacter nonamiensis TaxID=467093 RepID=UPI000348CBFB|nr:XdhC family protein [Ilumatobacter nonamiensis]
MIASQRHATRVAELVTQRRSFVRATVVRAQCPTSARPGDAAIVLPDGSIEGFVGGQCAEESVRTAALGALDSAESVLLRILPGDGDEFPETQGAVTVVNPCLSGGAIEVFLEPSVPAARIVVVGHTPIAEALAQFGAQLGFSMDPGDDVADVNGATAVLIASHGRDEEDMIRAALDAGVQLVGLVASRTRGRAVIDSLGLTDDERSRVRSPVGVDIGARTAEEIAVSILAEVVRSIRVDGLTSAPSSTDEPPPSTAIDPVCGMTVTVVADTPHLHHDGADYWFCNPGCRTRHAEELGVA